jgi:hypothetical protein
MKTLAQALLAALVLALVATAQAGEWEYRSARRRRTNEQAQIATVPAVWAVRLQAQCIDMLRTRSAALPCFAVGQATLAPPGGLPPSATPQFILFTHDDAVIPSTAAMLRKVVDGRSVNGCPLTATLFTQVQGTGVEAAGFRRHLTPAVVWCRVFHVSALLANSS